MTQPLKFRNIALDVGMIQSGPIVDTLRPPFDGKPVLLQLHQDDDVANPDKGPIEARAHVTVGQWNAEYKVFVTTVGSFNIRRVFGWTNVIEAPDKEKHYRKVTTFFVFQVKRLPKPDYIKTDNYVKITAHTIFVIDHAESLVQMNNFNAYCNLVDHTTRKQDIPDIYYRVSTDQGDLEATDFVVDKTFYSPMQFFKAFKIDPSKFM